MTDREVDPTLRQADAPGTGLVAPGRIRVFVVHDIRLYREGLAVVLERESATIEVVGTAATWDEAASALRVSRPDIVLLDVGMEDSLDVAREIVALPEGPRVVAVAVRDGVDDVLRCAELGISGYITRADSIAATVVAVESVARGELQTTPGMAAALFERVARLARAAPSPDGVRLTPREREVLGLIRAGLPNKLIAQRLHISVPTVKNHVHNILEKLQVASRGEAARRVDLVR